MNEMRKVCFPVETHLVESEHETKVIFYTKNKKLEINYKKLAEDDHKIPDIIANEFINSLFCLNRQENFIYLVGSKHQHVCESFSDQSGQGQSLDVFTQSFDTFKVKIGEVEENSIELKNNKLIKAREMNYEEGKILEKVEIKDYESIIIEQYIQGSDSIKPLNKFQMLRKIRLNLKNYETDKKHSVIKSYMLKSLIFLPLSKTIRITESVGYSFIRSRRIYNNMFSYIVFKRNYNSCTDIN